MQQVCQKQVTHQTLETHHLCIQTDSWKQKYYIESNNIVQKLIANYSAYKYWGVKSYIIMAKNYYGLKDVYQATYILENVIKNFKQFENLIQEAQTELDSIKEKEAKTNNSITPAKKELYKKETKNE